MNAPLQDRWYQAEAVDALFDYFANNGGIGQDGLPIEANPLVCLPTGTGKSVVIAKFVKRAMEQFPGTRVIMATHVKELIKQNAKKLQEAWPLAPLGIYSAGLKQKDNFQPIIFGGIQSLVGKFPMFSRRDLLVVDEAHLISNASDTSYLKFINELKYGENKPPKDAAMFNAILSQARNYNPYLKIIGLTATPYRLGLGFMTNGPIFTDIAYNLCTIDGFNRLIAEGFLCPPIPKRTRTELDVSGVGITAGEYKQNQLQEAVDKYETTFAALNELVNEGHNRRSWLIFASGVEHAEHIAELLNNFFGIPTVCVHSKKSDTENEANLKLWQTGQVRAAVNMNALTTGVDHPACDLIAMLRPTMSTGLWVQMLGRGTRPFDWYKLTPALQAFYAAFTGFVKENCLVLDFAGNTRRLGPINDPVIPKPKGNGPPGEAPVRICGQCGTYNHASAKICVVCGFEFPLNEKLNEQASNEELLRSDLPQIETFDVQRVVLSAYTSFQTKRESIKVSYYCSGAVPRTFYEYVSVQAESRFFKHKSREWFRQRYHYSTEYLTWGDDDVPATNAEVLALENELRHPSKIRVWVNKQNPEIMGYEF